MPDRNEHIPMRPLRSVAIAFTLLVTSCTSPSWTSQATPSASSTSAGSPSTAASPSATTAPAATAGIVTIGSPFFTDSLQADSGNGWPVGSTADASEAFVARVGYVMQLKSPSKVLRSRPTFAGINGSQFVDYAVDVQADFGLTVGSKDSVGLYCRNASSPSSTEFYSFLLRIDSVDRTETYEIWRDNTTSSPPARKLATSTVRAGGTVNKGLRAVCVGGSGGGPSTLVFSVDQKEVLRANDATAPLTSGLAGVVLYTSSSSSGMIVRFSNFVLSSATLGR